MPGALWRSPALKALSTSSEVIGFAWCSAYVVGLTGCMQFSRSVIACPSTVIGPNLLARCWTKVLLISCGLVWVMPSETFTLRISRIYRCRRCFSTWNKDGSSSSILSCACVSSRNYLALWSGGVLFWFRTVVKRRIFPSPGPLSALYHTGIHTNYFHNIMVLLRSAFSCRMRHLKCVFTWRSYHVTTSR